MKRAVFLIVCFVFSCSAVFAAAPQERETIAKRPYISALVVNAAGGEVLFEDNADAPVYPASMLKLMVSYIVLSQIEEGKLGLHDMVQVTQEAARMGGSQVYLDPRDQFSVEELLYALMVQSANDAATALAIHISGSREAFISSMNATAQQLAMNKTVFHSEHGLPPGQARQADVTTARDMAILCRELLKRPEILKYTSTTTRGFRNDTFTMRNHNQLLGQPPGVDGLKTGYFYLAGFSIAVTAPKDGQRVIALVMGSADRKERDAKALELLHKGLSQLPALPVAAQSSTPTDEAPADLAAPAPLADSDVKPQQAKTPSSGRSSGWGKFFLGLGLGLLLVVAAILIVGRILQRRRGKNQYLRR